MNGFKINRFGHTLCWVLSVNFRKLLLWFAGSVLAVFLGEFLFKIMNGFGDPYWMLRSFSQFLAGLMMIVSLIMISSVVSSISDKRKREAFLMLPSSNLEKYLSLVVYSTIICIAVAFLAIVLGDSLRMAWYWISGYAGPEGGTQVITEDGIPYYWWSSSIPMMLKELMPNIVIDGFDGYPLDYSIVELTAIYGFILWVHSLYTLGGTLLRKYSFVSISVFVILFMVLSFRLAFVLKLSVFHAHWDNGVLKGYEIGILGWIIAIAFPILSILNYWFSYRIFKGYELITNKWFNYDFHKR